MLIIYKWQKDTDISGGLCEEQRFGKMTQLQVTLKSTIFWMIGIPGVGEAINI